MMAKPKSTSGQVDRPALVRIIDGMRELLDGGMTGDELGEMLGPIIGRIEGDILHDRNRREIADRVRPENLFGVSFSRRSPRGSRDWNQPPTNGK